MHSLRTFVAAATLAALWLTPAAASAFQQTMTCTEDWGPYACDPGEDPQPVRWPRSCVTYRINDEGTTNSDAPPGLSDELVEAITWSFDQWTQVECSAMLLTYGGPTSTSVAQYNDSRNASNVNLVVFRDNQWQAVASDQTFALTSVTFNPNTGIISDADIEINSEIYPLSVIDPAESDHVDLRNTLVHEIGHFIGLDHVDSRNATMYPNAELGDTDKRSLAQDDIDGICHIYPAPADGSAPSCEDTSDNGDGGCCATTHAPAPTSTAWLLLGATLLGLAGWRRR